MHEMSIAAALIDQVSSIAERNGLVHVDRVEIEVGALQLVVAEALETAFSVMSNGTCAEGALLVQTEKKGEAECRECGHRFEALIDSYLCPQCDRADVEIVAGRDIILSSLTGAQREEGDLS